MNHDIPAQKFFKALSDSTRLNILRILRTRGSLCVCDIISELAQPQPTVSRHLNQLKQIGVLSSERRGTWVWYAINPDMPTWWQQVIELIDAD